MSKFDDSMFDTSGIEGNSDYSNLFQKPNKHTKASPEVEARAKEIWISNDLESQIEWGPNEWEPDETYGPCTGEVEFEDEIEIEGDEYIDYDTEKWSFTVPGYCERHMKPSIEGDIEFEAPDGSYGSFSLSTPFATESTSHTRGTLNEGTFDIVSAVGGQLQEEMNKMMNLMESIEKYRKSGESILL